MFHKVKKVGSTSKSHYNKSSNPNAEVPFEKEVTKISSLTLYVPRKIDIDKILERNPPNFRYHRDHFVYILHLITAVSSKKRDKIEVMEGYTPINRKFLQKRNYHYKKYLTYLKANGIIEQNHFYIPNKQSYGLRISSRYSSPIVPVEITKWTLIKSIVYLHQNINSELTEELVYLKKWFNPKIQVDIDTGVNYLKDEYLKDLKNPKITNPMLRFNARLLPLQKLYRNQYDFHIDNKGFRLHTNLSQLKSELRKCLKYNNEQLCAIDISNSQPYLSIALLDKQLFIKNNIQYKIINTRLTSTDNYPNMVVDFISEIENKPDVIEFKRIVASGNFYENFGEILIKEGIIDDSINKRKIAKEITFTTFFSPNNAIAYEDSIRIFKSKFPNVYKVFSLIKRGRKKHNTLAIALQRLEAELVLHRVCKIVNRLSPNIPIFTLHDSVITTVDNVQYVKRIMIKVLKKQIGVKPKLKLELWN